MESKFSNEEEAHHFHRLQRGTVCLWSPIQEIKQERGKAQTTAECLTSQGGIGLSAESGATIALGSIFQPVLCATKKIREEEKMRR